MAQMEKTRKLPDSPQTPRTSPTFEQHLRAEDANWSITMSPTIGKQHHHHDQEEYASPTNGKKSVIAKVKERAKKLKHSLSGKKRHGNESVDGSTTSPPSWGVTLDDDDEGESEKFVDPEYLGAPMYESEVVPDTLKETARQHPRAVPVVSEKHVLPDSMKHDATSTQGKSSPDTMNRNASNKIMAEKLAPADAAVSDATHTIANKISGLTVTTPDTSKTAFNNAQIAISPPGNKDTTMKMGENMGGVKISTPPGKWDKGISVKEYFMDTVEPGEDDIALSEAITEASSPKRSTSGGGPGVVDKVKEAVTSFFWRDESSNLTGNAAPPSSNANSQRHLLQNNAHSSKVTTKSAPANSQPLIPVFSTAHEVVEEQNHGKILQAN